MGKFETSNLQVIENYINTHPFTMSILIEKINRNHFEVRYANSLAMDLFSEDTSTSADKFFGECWSFIRRHFRFLKKESNMTIKIDLPINKDPSLFELDLQHQYSDERELILIELRARPDFAVERDKRIELQHKYSSVIDHNLDPIISVSKDLNIIHANPAVHTAFGYRLKELSGRSILNLVDERTIEQVRTFINRAFSGESIEMEGATFFHKHGKYFPVYLKAIPVLVEEGVTEIHLIVRDTSIHQENNEKLLFLSYHDPLTGLWNRRAMREHFAEDTQAVMRSGKLLSLIHIGLDRFKLINESLGHIGADEILIKVAEKLKCICPKSGRLYRNGGDEFIITFQSSTEEEVEKLGQKILYEFGKPTYYEHQEYFISGSIGIAIYPEDGTTFDEIISKSEQALTYVKENGRSHYRFYNQEMSSLFPDEVLMESHLRRAIELGELAVYYQPQVNLRTGHINSFEALLRWNSKKFGFVSPGQFIPLAEESGLIHNIGAWVLDQVCKQLKEWQEKRFRPVRIAVNISPKQFRMENFSYHVKQKIQQYEILPSSLEVEITESALTSTNETLATLNELKDIGVLISVDDFGTGYSSLSYLKQYPIDIIKIDRSFIQDIEKDEKNAAIAKTIINLAHNLGMGVIAEGVEKDLQASILLESNCQIAQGFLFSQAIPVDQVIDKYFAMNL